MWIASDPGNAERMTAVLRGFGFDTPELSAKLFLESKSMVRMGIPPMRIEILMHISGLDFSQCYPERVSDFFDGVEVDLISLQHLKINKKASGRYKDLDDLEHLP